MKFDIPTQVVFRPEDEKTFTAGIAYNDVIICGCCGGVFEIEEIPDIYPYSDWMDIRESITGGELPEGFPLDAVLS